MGLGGVLAGVGGIVGGLGGLFGNKGGQTVRQAPWKQQEGPILFGFEKALEVFGDRQAQGPYKGQYIADKSPQFQNALNNTAGLWGANDRAYSGVSAAAGGASKALTSAAGTANAGLNNAAAMNRPALNKAANVGLSGLTQGVKTAQALTNDVDRVGSMVGGANRIINNDVIQGQIDAASRDVVRNFRENELTGINAEAIGAGNVNSTRTGIAEGLAQRGAEDRVGDIAAQIRGDAYNNGLALTAQSDANEAATRLGAANALGYMGQVGNSAANTVIGSAMSAAQQGFGNSMAATQAGFGNQMAAANFGQQGRMGAAQAGLAGAQVGQQYNQSATDAARQQWYDQNRYQQDVLNDYFSIIGGQQFGGQQTTAGQKGNIFSGLQQGLGTAASVMGLYGMGQNYGLWGGGGGGGDSFYQGPTMTSPSGISGGWGGDALPPGMY